MAKLVISGVGSIVDMTHAYMLDEKVTNVTTTKVMTTNAPTTAPSTTPFGDACPAYAQAQFYYGDLAYQYVATIMCLAFFVAWVRRSTNQRAVLLGFGVESALSMGLFVYWLLLQKQAMGCLGFPSDFWTTFNGVLQVLLRLAQSVFGIMAGCTVNKINKIWALGFVISCAAYFTQWFIFQIFIFDKSLGDMFDAEYKNFVDTIARSAPGAAAGMILLMQASPAAPSEIQMP